MRLKCENIFFVVEKKRFKDIKKNGKLFGRKEVFRWIIEMG